MVKENSTIIKVNKAMGLHKWVKEEKPSELESEKSNGPDIKYTAWLENHPSALASFQRMMNTVQGKQMVVLLDYDGTLSPIVGDPDRPFHVRFAVRGVARLFPTAIISGRGRDKVYEFVKFDGVYYAGSHGLDIMGPSSNSTSLDPKLHMNTLDQQGNEITIFQPAKPYLPSINKMLIELKQRSKQIPGAFVEDNTFCISVHYRHVLEEDYEALEEMTKEVLADYPFFHITWGKKVLEIRPPIKWNKGDALVYLLETLGFSNPNAVIPFYLGDDKTDEDAFMVLRSRGQGYPIVVSSVPRETCASFSLRDPRK